MVKNKLIMLLLVLSLSVVILTACGTTVTEEISYTINFETNGGNTISPLVVNAITDIDLPDDPEKAGYVFNGWFYDNNTFLDAVTAGSYATKLSANTLSITLYAKWINEEDLITLLDAKASLTTAVAYMYLNINNEYTDLSTEDADRLAELNILLDYDAAELQENYEDAFIAMNKFLTNGLLNFNLNAVNQYITVYESYVDINTISVPDAETLDSIIFSLFLDEELDYTANYNEVVIMLNNHNNLGMDQDDYNLYSEYYFIASDKLDYVNYLEGITEFNADFATLLAMFGNDDIRPYKLMNVADYLVGYDYDTIMVEKSEDYFEPDSTLLDDMVLDLIDESGFTSDDIGLLTDKYIRFSMTKATASLENKISKTEDNMADALNNKATAILQLAEISEEESPELFKQLTDQISMFQKNYDNGLSDIAGYNDTIAMYEDLDTTLTLAMLTDYSEIILGVYRIFNNNNLFDLFTGDSEPSITELSTIISSLKQACDDITATYTLADWTNLTASLSSIFDVITENQGQEELFDEFFAPFLSSSFNPITSLEKVSDILSLFDADTLDLFLNVEETLFGSKFVIDKNNEFFYSNLAILEAKLITTISDVYVEGDANAAYLNFKAQIMEVIPSMAGSGTEGVGLEGEIGLPIIVDMIFDILNDKLIMTTADYVTVTAVAALDYGDTVTNAMYEALIFTPAIICMNSYVDNISEFSDYLEMDITTDIANGIASVLFIFDIDKDKLTDYVTYVKTLDIDNNNTYIIMQLIDGLFLTEVGFTNQEIMDIINLFGSYGIVFLEEYSSEAVDFNAVIKAVIDDVYNDSAYIESLSYLLLTLLRSTTDVYLNEANPLTGKIDDPSNFVDTLVEALEDFKDVSYETLLEQEDLIALLSKALIVLKEVAIMNLEEDSDITAADVNVIYDMVIALFSVYGFDGTIDKIELLAYEFLAAGGPDAFKVDEEENPNPDEFIFLANAILILFPAYEGSFDTVTFTALISASDEGKINDVLQAIIDNYDDIITISEYVYGEVELSDPTYSGLVNQLMTAIRTALGIMPT